jgi:hypothetical protein
MPDCSAIPEQNGGEGREFAVRHIRDIGFPLCNFGVITSIYCDDMTCRWLPETSAGSRRMDAYWRWIACWITAPFARARIDLVRSALLLIASLLPRRFDSASETKSLISQES